MGQNSTPSYADVYRHGRRYGALPAAHRQAGSIPVDFTRVLQGDGERHYPPTRSFAFGVALGGKAALEVDFGEGLRRFDVCAGGMYVNPTLNDTLCRQVGAPDVLFVSAPLDDIANRLEVQTATLNRALRPLHDEVLTDLRLRNQCLGMWENAARAGPYASLAVDHGVLALVTALMARSRPGEEPDGPATAPLADDRLARVIDFVEASLSRPVKLDDLAAVAGLSPFHFARSFKAATGTSPHQYLTERRIQQACKLLAFGRMPLIEVAHASGFASQSHMTDVFRGKLGVTPGRYRRDVGG